MALIEMKLYDDLEKDINSALQTQEVYSVKLKKIKKDLKKRKTGRIARIVILSIWAVILVGCVLVASGLLEFGGAEGTVGSTPVEKDPIITWAMIPMLFVPATWTLCFVGFPIGWNWTKSDRDKAKTDLCVTTTVDEDGYVETHASTLPSRISAFIFSLFQGALTMVASVPIAIVQCFTWKKQIARIENLVATVEANPNLFVPVD